MYFILPLVADFSFWKASILYGSPSGTTRGKACIVNDFSVKLDNFMRCIAADLVNTWMVRWLVKLIIFILKRRKSLSHFQWVSFLYLDLHQERVCYAMWCYMIWYYFTAKIIHTSPKRKLYGLTLTHFYSFLTWFITWLLFNMATLCLSPCGDFCSCVV